MPLLNRKPAQVIPLTIYGTEWCAATQFVRRYFDKLNLQYTYRDLDSDLEAAEQVKWWTGGYKSHPTVQVGGDLLIEPNLRELQNALSRHNLI